MRKALLIIAIVLQVLVLVYMAGKREYIGATGTVVYLRTAPIDPRDLFRGDYVRLRYEASVVPREGISADIAEQIKNYKFGGEVYAPLMVRGGLAEVTGLLSAKPAAGLFLKGRLAQPSRFGLAVANTAAVEYGIEAYYLQQGKGLEIEKRQGTWATLQTPLEMEIAVGRDGTAVIRGHRWSPIGIGLEVVESPLRDAPQGRKSAKLRLTLKNTSQKPMALVNLPEACSLSLEPVSSGQKAKPPARPRCSGLAPADTDVLVLQPGESRPYDIDLADMQWQVIKDDALVETGPLDWSERFRIVYRPPSPEATAQLRDSALIWHGQLPSRAFHGRGNID